MRRRGGRGGECVDGKEKTMRQEKIEEVQKYLLLLASYEKQGGECYSMDKLLRGSMRMKNEREGRAGMVGKKCIQMGAAGHNKEKSTHTV